MKRILATVFALLVSAGLLSACAHNPDSTALANGGEPHAVLQFSGGLQVQRLIPLYLWSINGTRVFKQEASQVVLEPGSYELEFRAKGIRNRGHVPDANIAVPGTTQWQETDDTIKVTLQPGMVYYIGGKPHGNGAWSAVVWKKASQG
ncbi:MAG TPA: hypothetical protein VFH57_06965 [Gammaproteobacteria bacterium]|nr:hypothetical protein [Gammaproteobacteria bacterium]